MASNLKPKKTGRLRSRLKRLFSPSGTRGGQDGEAGIAQDLQAPVQDPSFSDNSKGLTPSSGEESCVPVVGPQRGYTKTIAEDVPSSTAPSASMSMLSRAHHFNVGGNIQIDSSQYVHTLNAQDGWKMLLENIAPNAFYNSGARFDPPKCDEDTRVEVISEIMDWIGDRKGPKRLLCMTGAAGAGKSALQQTIAERCASSRALGCGIFLSSQDPTRNNLTRIIPTIAFQLGQHDLRLQDYIKKGIERDPPIFTRTIQTQMDILIVRPFKQLQANASFDAGSFPHVVLIDGLDECSGEERQAELLTTIKHCLLDDNLPFRIFIASRPEWAIRSALNSETQGYLHPLAYHIQLSDKYDATDDTRRYLWRRLQDIGSRSYDPWARSQSWPTVEDIEKLVIAASGQFVYAATIVKYVSERRSSPVDRLQTVVDWTPKKGQLARPFEALDVLYASILSAAKESYEAVDTNLGRNFLLLLRAHHINSVGRVGGRWEAHQFDGFLNLERRAHEVLISDLHSLVVFHPHPDSLKPFIVMHFYHRSFSEFLDTETRSKNMFVPEIQVKAYVSETIVHGIDRLLSEHSESIKAPAMSVFTLFFRQYLCNFGQYREECSGCPSVYSNAGEMLDGQKILALTHNDGWSKFDQVIPQAFVAVGDAPQLLKMIYVIMKRLKNELKEPGLADALKPYYKKWRKIVKTDLARWMHEVNRLPPEDPEEGETEKGEEAQEELDSSTGKVLR